MGTGGCRYWDIGVQRRGRGGCKGAGVQGHDHKRTQAWGQGDRDTVMQVLMLCTQCVMTAEGVAAVTPSLNLAIYNLDFNNLNYQAQSYQDCDRGGITTAKGVAMATFSRGLAYWDLDHGCQDHHKICNLLGAIIVEGVVAAISSCYFTCRNILKWHAPVDLLALHVVLIFPSRFIQKI